MKRLALIALAGVLAVPTLAHAQRLAPMKAGALGKMCSSSASRTACDAYLSGLTDGVTLARSTRIIRAMPPPPRAFVCRQAKTLPPSAPRCSPG